jgi:hypothetical protein
MQLPAELGLEIFQQVFGGNVYPHIQHVPTLGANVVVLGSNHRNSPPRRYHDVESAARPDPPNYTTLRVNKTIRAEALKAGWEGTAKRFVEVDSLIDMLAAPVSATPSFKWLTQVQIEFDFLQYFEFFGVKIHPTLQIVAADSKGSLLKVCTSLIDLELFFRDPYSIHDNPWQTFVDRRYSDDWFQQDIRYTSMSRFPCHTEVVDWIITFAFPFYQGHSHHTLHGCYQDPAAQEVGSHLPTRVRGAGRGVSFTLLRLRGRGAEHGHQPTSLCVSAIRYHH